MSLGPLMVDIAGCDLTAEDRELLTSPQVGGVILFARNYRSPAQVAALVSAIHALRAPPLLVAVDQEGGRVQRFREGFTSLPPLRSIGRQYDLNPRAALALAHTAGWLMASEVRATGVDFSFAPVVDLDYGVSEIIGDRSLHSDPEVVAQLAIAYAAGMRAAGMPATAKHFPGHGAVVADSHTALPIDRRTLVDLDGDLLPYRRLIDNHLSAVMAAHVVFTQVDAVPASLSRVWITRILRGEMGFHGCVFADDLTMAGAAAFGGIAERAQMALDAGCDVLPICNDRKAAIAVLDEIRTRGADPASQARLVRMHGRGDHSDLFAGAQWRAAVVQVQSLDSAPELTLTVGES